MRNWFKPLSKRNAKFAAAVIGFLLIYGIIGFFKDLFSGLTFDELRSNVLLLIFGIIIEYAMITIAFSKDKPEEEAGQAAQEADNEEGSVDLLPEASIDDDYADISPVDDSDDGSDDTIPEESRNE